MEFTDEVEQVHADQRAQVLQLNQVQPADAALDRADAFLRHTPSTGHVGLGQSSLMPCCQQHVAQEVGFGAMEGLGHPARIRGPPNAIFSKLYR